MHNRSNTLLVLGKLLVAAVAIVALVAVPARLLAPTLSVAELLLYCAIGLAGVLALLVLGSVCSLQFSQFVLRKGGTDAQWFWFSGEPKGLAALRKDETVDGERRAES